MPSKAYLENLSTIEVFAATSISTTVNSGTPAVVDRSTDGGTENAIGCPEVVLFVNITVGPSAATALNAYVEWSFDGTNYTVAEYCCTCPVAASATGYRLIGPVMMMAPYAKFYLIAPSATLTAALYASPAYYEAQ